MCFQLASENHIAYKSYLRLWPLAEAVKTERPEFKQNKSDKAVINCLDKKAKGTLSV